MAIVSRLLSTRAREQPDSPAYRSGADGRALNWREVAAHAAGWQDVRPVSRVGLVIADPLVFTAAYLGCLSAGLTVAPIDPRLTATELSEVLTRLRVDVLATDHAEPVIRPELDIFSVDLTGPRLIWSATTASRPSDAAALRPAVLLTSSGTTGRPKGIPLTEWQLMHAAGRVARHHGFGPGERGYTPLPLFHVNAQVMGLLATVAGGGSLVIDRRFEAAEYWARVEEHSATWLNAVPAILASLAKQPPPPAHVIERIRFARSASAPLPPETARAFAEHTGVGVLETYGMSEAAGQITANPLDAAQRRSGSVGLPVELELIVGRPDGTPVAPGEEGEVLLRGPQIVDQYLELDGERPERTRPARTTEGWLRTGDVGRLDDAGFLTLAGRADDVINRGGEKIYPQEVENVLLAHPGVAAVAVVGAPHERLGQVPVAFVTSARSDSGRLAESLASWCAERLTRYKRPTVIEVTDALPLGPTGKVLRRALRAELASTQ
ncbi:acyl--CoA ligase [Amycolatopsis acidicola]|uniref:Acyl--CoA ligase n=1 Tax=Amycolatopsis acidicola TaxID=2596893 RepID=A0A5N0UQY9_9PSEU|nr:class I adenylate-forming enzyme family protein [Amycolatopsis acidicola]KAA9151178.1 acyl--CoA ligase [Amycolatopsis acidicola]